MNNIIELLLALVKNAPETIACNTLVYTSKNYKFLVSCDGSAVYLTVKDESGNVIYRRPLDCGEREFFTIRWKIEDWIKYFETKVYLELDELVSDLAKTPDAYDKLVDD